jgi:protein-tyrosine phosphatase
VGGHDRHLEWDGSWNARDLGGLPTSDGRRTRRGALVRADHMVHLTAPGWSALQEHGIRTLVDLRTRDEGRQPRQDPPGGVTVVRTGLEDGLDQDEVFRGWVANGLFSTPLYYAPFLRRWPDRCAAAVAAIARAPAGGVLVHCSKGCDRTGLVVMLVLVLCGVPDEAIVGDYAMTLERQRGPRATALGLPDDAQEIRDALATQGCPDVQEAMRWALRDSDVLGDLRRGGLRRTDEDALRVRLLTDPRAVR